MKSKRQSNIEALRIIAMTFIVFGHVSYTLCNNTLCREVEKYILDITSIGVCSVDLFVLITGYFLINRLEVNIKRVIKILSETIFYCFTITFIFHLFGKATLYDCLSSLNPLAPTRFNYWFVTKYIGLILVHPFLSRFAVSLTKLQYKSLLIVLLLLTTNLTPLFPLGTLFCTGWTLWWFITLFFVGGYMRLFFDFKNLSIWKSICVMTICAILIIFLKDSSIFDCSYNSLLTLTLAVATFCTFNKITFNSDRIIRFIAPNVFAVFLIHSHNFFLPYVKQILDGIEINLLLISFFSSIIIFIFSVLIDKMVKYFAIKLRINQAEEKIASTITRKLKLWLS